MSLWPAGAYPPRRPGGWDGAAAGRDECGGYAPRHATFAEDRCPITR